MLYITVKNRNIGMESIDFIDLSASLHKLVIAKFLFLSHYVILLDFNLMLQTIYLILPFCADEATLSYWKC